LLTPQVNILLLNTPRVTVAEPRLRHKSSQSVATAAAEKF